jgi:hypothetical protein
MDLLARLDGVQQQSQKNFGTLTESQLNWKPSPEKWSIGQCLDHLINTNKTYFPTFDSILSGKHRLSFFQKINPFKKSIGAMMVRTLGPQVQKKFTAPKIFEPSSSNITPSIVNDFSVQQETVKTYFRKLIAIEPSKIFIASPVSSLFVYSLEDALQIIAGHEERHLTQAEHVLQHSNFPT